MGSDDRNDVSGRPDPWATNPPPQGGEPPPPQWGGPPPPHRGEQQWGQPASDPQPGIQAVPQTVPAPEGGLLENAVRVLTSPVDTLRRLTHHPRTGWAVILVAVIGALSFVAGFSGFDPAGQPGDPFMPDIEALRPALLVGGFVLGPIVALLVLVIWTAILHGLARLFKGTGTFGGTATGVAFSYVPSALAIPFQLLPLVMGVAGSAIASLVSLGVSIWSLVLVGIAIREGHRISTGRAVATVLIPIGVLILLGILVLVLIIALAVGLATM